ncbi:Protein of unknown function [Gryllus bimaculatus]|nr:Protein of unknown function [Gryllus bimaculatus]
MEFKLIRNYSIPLEIQHWNANQTMRRDMRRDECTQIQPTCGCKGLNLERGRLNEAELERLMCGRRASPCGTPPRAR